MASLGRSQLRPHARFTVIDSWTDTVLTSGSHVLNGSHSSFDHLRMKYTSLQDVVVIMQSIASKDAKRHVPCADVMEIRKKYSEEGSLYSLFRNVIPEAIFGFLKETGAFHEI